MDTNKNIKKKQKEAVKSSLIKFRCTDSEKKKIYLSAKKEELSVSEYIRSKVLKFN